MLCPIVELDGTRPCREEGTFWRQSYLESLLDVDLGDELDVRAGHVVDGYSAYRRRLSLVLRLGVCLPKHFERQKTDAEFVATA